MQPAGTYLNGDRSQICLTTFFFLFLKKKKEKRKKPKFQRWTPTHTTTITNTSFQNTTTEEKRKKKKEKKKEDRSCRSRHVEPTTIIGCKPIYIPLFILLFCSAPSLFLSLILSLSLSLTLTHTHTDPETLEFPCSVVQIFVENLYWFSVVSENRGGFN